MTKEQMNEIAEQALHHACAYIQDQIGQKQGDIAGMFFCGENEDTIHHIFRQYLQTELAYKERGEE